MANNVKKNADQFSKLTDGERLDIIRKLYVERNMVSEILTKINHVRERAKVIDEPKSLVLTGDTGMGKTTLLKAYLEEHPMSFVDNCMVRPVVYTSLPVKTNINGAATELLRAMEVSEATKGTFKDRTHLITTQLNLQKVEVVLVDETQHVVEASGDRTLYKVGDFFKDISKKTKVPFVLTGMPNTRQILTENPQLRRLCRCVTVGPFSCDTKEDALVFRRFLKNVDAQLPFVEWSRFGDPDPAGLIFLATEGKICHVMALIREAAILAIEDGSASISNDHLMQAFDSELDSVVLAKNNPFDPVHIQAALKGVAPKAA